MGMDVSFEKYNILMHFWIIFMLDYIGFCWIIIFIFGLHYIVKML